MKNSYLFLLINVAFFCSCGSKLDQGKALDVLNREFPIDTAWQTSKIYFGNLNLAYLAKINIIKLRVQQLSSVAGEDGIGAPVPIENNWNSYELTDWGKALVVNQDLANNIIIAKSYYVANYKVKSVYFETEGSNQAEVEFEVAYALTPFSGLNVELESSMNGGPDDKGNEISHYNYGVSFFKTLKCKFKKFDTGWGIDDKDQVASEIASLSDVKLDAARHEGAITITTVNKIPLNK